MRSLSPSVAILRTQSDERLVALAREGHEAAFTAIVERYRRPMLAAARRFLPEARAEDAVQQTFVAAWKGLQRGDEVRELRPWLYRIARNTSLNALRTPGYDAVELQESLRFGEAPQEELERREAVRRTLAGLAALPERQREALLRTAVGGAAHADIARDLGLSEGATRQLVMRARTTLRSAASALVPFPVLQWMVTGGATAGTLAKASAVVVVAGTAVATPVAVVDDTPRREPAPKRQAASPSPTTTPAAPVPSREPAAARTGVADELVVTPQRRRRRVHEQAAPPPASTPAPTRRSNSGPGSLDSGSGSRDDDDHDDDRSGPGGGTDDPAEAPEIDNSGPGSVNSGSASSGSGSSGSGSGSDDDDLPEVEEPDDDSSGSGSDHD